ncbi:MAG TPA: hypothetical protein ENO22_14350 [candidate division Zixibacteria bacterium]|nr:hypothetical protein [candidate division Zixibacteria bacterium]
MDKHNLDELEVPESFLELIEKETGKGENVDLTRASQIKVDRDTYLEAQARGMSLSELLESEGYDPSTDGSPLDAFERQLACHGIRVAGRDAITVEQFFQSASALMPEFIMREIKRGMELRPEYNRLIAATSRINTNRYTPLYIDTSPTDTRLSLRQLGEGAEIPQINITEQLSTITVPDYGVALKTSYKVLRHRSTAQFKVILWYIGFRLQADKVALIADVIQNGDGNDNAAQVVQADSSGTLDYDDFVKFWVEFAPYEMNTLICHKDMIRKILNLTEFKDPQAGFKFQSSGKLVNPLGASVVRCDEVADDLIIGLDHRFAAEEVVSQPLMVEFDKIIEQKFEEAVISESIGYAKVIPEASMVLDTVYV